MNSVAYSPDGRYITIRIWDADSSAAVGDPLNEHTGPVQSIAYSPNGRHIISGSDNYTIQIWDSRTGLAVCKPLKGIPAGCCLLLALSMGVTSSLDPLTTLFKSGTSKIVMQSEPLEGHTDSVQSVAYSLDGLHIMSGSSDCTI